MALAWGMSVSVGEVKLLCYLAVASGWQTQGTHTPQRLSLQAGAGYLGFGGLESESRRVRLHLSQCPKPGARKGAGAALA